MTTYHVMYMETESSFFATGKNILAKNPEEILKKFKTGNEYGTYKFIAIYDMEALGKLPSTKN